MRKEMRRTMGALVALVVILGGTVAVAGTYYLITGAAETSKTQSTQSAQLIQAIGAGSPDPAHPRIGDFFPYACRTPAINTSRSCDVLPAGYVILPRLPVAPQLVRPAGMTDSAWVLLQKTFANGVCDPNETWITDPLDCAASGNQLNDPFTGRPGAPASVCQLIPIQEAKLNQSG